MVTPSQNTSTEINLPISRDDDSKESVFRQIQNQSVNPITNDTVYASFCFLMNIRGGYVYLKELTWIVKLLSPNWTDNGVDAEIRMIDVSVDRFMPNYYTVASVFIGVSNEGHYQHPLLC